MPPSCESWLRQVRIGNYGERGIRTPDTAFGPYNDLANRRLQPLGHLSTRETTEEFYETDCKIGALWRIRTTDLLIRSQMLYPAELRARELGKVSNPWDFSRQLA